MYDFFKDGKKLWEKSFADLLYDKYTMKILHYSKTFENFLIIERI